MQNANNMLTTPQLRVGAHRAFCWI